jgi:phosphoribosyl-ATP pyrophosphohydrolase
MVLLHLRVIQDPVLARAEESDTVPPHSQETNDQVRGKVGEEALEILRSRENKGPVLGKGKVEEDMVLCHLPLSND